ncbi:MAG: hypothetical protein J6S97_07210 [Bacteroidales bacterium]|nr:hypothetical protein [Bacteroidales bacterium]
MGARSHYMPGTLPAYLAMTALERLSLGKVSPLKGDLARFWRLASGSGAAGDCGRRIRRFLDSLRSLEMTAWRGRMFR